MKADGFIKGFSSITADSNADLALLYTDKAAMMLHGSWTYGTMSTDGGDFVSGGNLGYMNFPPVEGDKGDPTATTGNPAQYLSISSKATDAQKETAKKFFATGVLTDAEIQEFMALLGPLPSPEPAVGPALGRPRWARRGRHCDYAPPVRRQRS